MTAVDKVLTEHCAAAVIELVLERCLWSLGVQLMFGSVLFSSSTSKLNLLLRNVMWSEITWLLVSFT